MNEIWCLPFLVICGPSGVGKGSLVGKLQERFPAIFECAVSYTSRKPRLGEKNGVHYFFVSKSEFEHSIKDNQFIEFTQTFDHYYGTPLKEIQRITQLGRICLLEIDLKGVKQIQSFSPSAKSFYIHIRPPDLATLELRLRGRSTESDAQIQLRMQVARQELQMAQSMYFDCHLINDTLEKCYQELEQTLCRLYAPFVTLLNYAVPSSDDVTSSSPT